MAKAKLEQVVIHTHAHTHKHTHTPNVRIEKIASIKRFIADSLIKKVLIKAAIRNAHGCKWMHSIVQ